MRACLQKVSLFFLIAVFLTGCATSQTLQQQNAANELRVGVTPNYPPIIFEQGGVIAGVEADLARQLGKELQLPVRFVKLNRDERIQALLDGTIDIIMSGMSVTKAREIRITFTEPYLKSGLVAAMRAEDAKNYGSKESILNGFVTVAAVKDTTGDTFVNKNFPNAVRKMFVRDAQDGAYELKRRAIDIFVHDAPAIIWLVSENEADIAGLWEPFNEEYFAWGVRKDDKSLLTEVNAVLQRWKKDGTLTGVLQKWLPEGYFKKMYQKEGL